jgi:hypothetical protein
VTTSELIAELSLIIDPAQANGIVESYVEVQQRFLAGDWKPAELDGGRLCEAVARALYQLDGGAVTHSQLPGELCEKIEDANNKRAHNLPGGDRHHLCKAIALVYKFRSSRGPVHISPVYTANYMDSMLVLHACKWIFADFLRLAWKKDQRVIAETIAQIVQLQHTLIHELDGKPLVLQPGIPAREEILLLVGNASTNRLSRVALRERASHQKPATLNAAITKLLASKELRTAENGDLALTPNGQRTLQKEIIPKYAPNRE